MNGAGHWVEALAAGEDGSIWTASDGGLYRWDGQKWTGWDAAQGAPTGDIFAMLPHGGNMWIAGHGGEISRWDATDGWQRFRPKGLTADVLDMYVSQDGALWLATETACSATRHSEQHVGSTNMNAGHFSEVST